MREAVARMSGSHASVVFTAHLVPMTRGILATCYARGRLSTDQALRAARDLLPEVEVIMMTAFANVVGGADNITVALIPVSPA